MVFGPAEPVSGFWKRQPSAATPEPADWSYAKTCVSVQETGNATEEAVKAAEQTLHVILSLSVIPHVFRPFFFGRDWNSSMFGFHLRPVISTLQPAGFQSSKWFMD